MGACLGHCFSKITNPLTYRYQRHTSTLFQEGAQVERNPPTNGQDSVKRSGTSKSLLTFLSLKRFKKKHGVPDSLELTEDTSWSRGYAKYSRLKSRNEGMTSSGFNSPLETLDARTLMKHQGRVSSTPASSLDLEWEHEVALLPAALNAETESTNDSPPRSWINNSNQPSTASPWSRVSTPNSLEWDPVESVVTCVDVETEQLLHEIERLTDRALKETGEWTGSS